MLLQLKAEIVTLIDVAPTDTPIIRMSVGDPKPTELTLSATNGKAFDVLALQADPSVAVTVRPAPGAPAAAAPSSRRRRPRGKSIAAGRSRYLITITPKPDLPAGQSFANVALTTDFPRAESVPIRAILIVAGRVRVVPDRLVVQPAADGPVLHARISKQSGDGLKILGVESSDPDFTASATAVTEGRDYDLTVRYKGKPGRGAVSSRITVKTNEPGQAELMIPIVGRI